MQNLDSIEEKILWRIPFDILILSFVLAVAAIFLFDPLTSLFVFAGGTFSAISFIWLKHSLVKFLIPDKKKVLKYALASYGFRLLLILVIFFIIIIFFSKKIIAFVAGFSTIIIVFFVEAVVAISKFKKWKN